MKYKADDLSGVKKAASGWLAGWLFLLPPIHIEYDVKTRVKNFWGTNYEEYYVYNHKIQYIKATFEDYIIKQTYLDSIESHETIKISNSKINYVVKREIRKMLNLIL